MRIHKEIVKGWLAVVGVLILCYFFMGCAKKVPVANKSGVGGVVDGEKYFYDCQGPTCLVVVQSNGALDAAKKEIGCGLCSEEHIGEAYAIERLGK